MTRRFEYKIGVIGAGNMGEALIRGLLRSRLVRPFELIASNRNKEKLAACRRKYQIHTSSSNQEVLEGAQTIILAVKPQNMDEVLPEIRPLLSKEHLVISIAAGIDTQKLRKGLGNRPPLVRVMPNLPALIDAGIAGLYCTRNVSARQRRFAHQIFEAVGKTVDVPKEKWLDAITGLSGTGPAYVFALIEGLLQAGKKVGLPQTMVKKLTLETVYGAAEMALQTGLPPQDLRAKVTSKKGTTWAAMKVFKKFRFWDLIIQAVSIATKRARQLRGR